ncbi:T9SS type A sorting domain-containing protein [Flavivirga spongiicola]|uniref:T9SS type A sorting domain-containing protein n=1 Tax=Flavivirga spongiicola TaxID=421621 RepID=A0ABU7XYC8_9FLAO|nr:T9SS type A sorting domain-containing protein [Flavivirga sp. MEBiC05379]MDO5980796.1 T9SS type A sorting domain-containing protein [Flavivirga sp. MEBiC05379]
MKKNSFKLSLCTGVSTLICFFLCVFIQDVKAQNALYVGDGGILYLKKDLPLVFNGNLSRSATGNVVFEAGTNLSSLTDYFAGSAGSDYVSVYGAGTTVVPVGSSIVRSPITIVSNASNDNFSIGYFLNDPAVDVSASLDAALSSSNYFLSDDEYWTVNKVSGTSNGYVISGTTPKSDAKYDGSDGTSYKMVWFNGSQWEEYVGDQKEGSFSYVSQKSALGIDDEHNIGEFLLYPNPVSAVATNVYFTLPANVQQLSVTVYDVTGKRVANYNNIPVRVGVNSISKPELSKGLYFLKFSFNNRQQYMTKRLVVQ